MASSKAAAKTRRVPALEQLEQLRAQVRDAEARVRELEAERLKARRALDRAKAPLLEYYEQLGAGERKPDPKLERELTARVREVEAHVSTRPVQRSGTIELEVTDDRIEAQLAGAQRVIAEREAAVVAFIRDHQGEMAAELSEQSIAARDRLVAAWEELQAAIGEWSRVRAAWTGYGEHWGLSPAEIPANPAAGATGDLERAFAPLYSGEARDPRRLLPMPARYAPAEGEREATVKEPATMRPVTGHDLARTAGERSRVA